jgi:hypothetical protein
MGETLGELRDKYEAFLRSEVCTVCCNCCESALHARVAMESLSHTIITLTSIIITALSLGGTNIDRRG